VLPTGGAWRNITVGLVLSGLTLCGCGTARSANPPQPLSRAKADTSTTTSSDPTSATSEVTLSEVFREEGVLLMGTAPSIAETLDFVAYYQYIDEACEQAEHSSSCPVMTDADVIAQMYLEQHNLAAIESHQSASSG
jgi:hypothetical protein